MSSKTNTRAHHLAPTSTAVARAAAHATNQRDWAETLENVASLRLVLRQALLSSAGTGPNGDPSLPQALVGAMPEGGTTTTSTADSSGSCGTTETAGFMPNLLLVLQSPTHVSPAEAEGGPGWLDMAIMGALDEFEAVPPAIVSCVPPASSGSSSTTPLPSTFDAALLDMPLSEVWQREARRHFE